MLDCLIENARIARTEQMPICQDTGMAVVFVDLGQELRVEGDLYAAINAGVAKGYKDGYLRKSIVRHPLDRVNTGDNTPAVVHLRLVPGDKLKITLAPKGFGSENMGGIAMPSRPGPPWSCGFCCLSCQCSRSQSLPACPCRRRLGGDDGIRCLFGQESAAAPGG